MDTSSVINKNPGHLAHPKYRADIDGIRAIAVLSVVGFHAFPDLFQGGFVGVDIFFTISGFLISIIIFDSLKQNTFSFIEFYSRRIKRIFPALILVLVACFIFGWFALFADEYRQLGKHIAGGSGFVSNLVLWSESGYFDNSANAKPLLHLWSLGIEEQFYIVWPLILWFAWKKNINLLLVVFIFAASSFILNIYMASSNVLTLFYLPQTRFWELLFGSILGYITLYENNPFTKVKNKIVGYLPYEFMSEVAYNNIKSLVGAVFIISGFTIITKEMSFPGWWAAIPTIGTVLILSSNPRAWLNRTILSNRILVWFGLISFPLYLWHWPLLSFLYIIEGENLSNKAITLSILLSIVLAYITCQFVEKPIRFGKYRKATIMPLIILMIIVGCTGYGTYRYDGFENREHTEKRQKQLKLLVGWDWEFSRNEICESQYPYKYSIFCMKNTSSPPTLILLGNSYANHLFPGIINNKELNHHSVLSFGSCDPSHRSGDDCVTQDKIIEDNPSIKFAILSNSWPRFDDSGQQVHMHTGVPYENTPTRSEYIEALDSRLKFLTSKGINIIIFGPKPEINYDIRNCFARPFKTSLNTCEILPETIQVQQGIFLTVIDSVIERNPEVGYFDQNHIFCDSNGCNAIQDALPLLRDAGHYSQFGSQQVINSFASWANTNSPEILE